MFRAFVAAAVLAVLVFATRVMHAGGRRYFTSPSTEPAIAQGGIVPPSNRGWRRGWAEPEGPEAYIPTIGRRRPLGEWFGEG